jgi:endonuclease/exonuclease/phosphatase family metal-dependent hydrolase
MPGLRLLSYNVAGRRGHRAAQAELVRTVAPDVAVVQEAPRHWGWRRRCAALANSWGLVVAAGGMPAVGNLILTSLRVQVERTWYARFPLTRGRHLRGAVFARCQVAGATVVVAGAHLATDPAERPRQARLLRGLLDKTAAPVALGADLNDEPGSATWQILTGRLLDAGAAAGAPTFPRTGRRIDAILTDARLVTSGYQVLDTPLARRASDHFPLVVDLSVPAGGGGQDQARAE